MRERRAKKSAAPIALRAHRARAALCRRRRHTHIHNTGAPLHVEPRATKSAAANSVELATRWTTAKSESRSRLSSMPAAADVIRGGAGTAGFEAYGAHLSASGCMLMIQAMCNDSCGAAAPGQMIAAKKTRAARAPSPRLCRGTRSAHCRRKKRSHTPSYSVLKAWPRAPPCAQTNRPAALPRCAAPPRVPALPPPPPSPPPHHRRPCSAPSCLGRGAPACGRAAC